MVNEASPHLAINVRQARTDEYPLMAEHFLQMWRDNDVPTQALRPDGREQILGFIEHARGELCYRGFVAETGADGRTEAKIVGSANCQLFAGLFPDVLESDWCCYGYIWGVYVDAAYRRRGIATSLTLSAVQYLKTIRCTRVILHASATGRPVYERLGFVAADEMRLDL
jgi:GNAT superfamily N-acetyltransferase